MNNKKNCYILIITFLVSFASDIAVKLLALRFLKHKTDIIPGFFSLDLSFNYGAAFGILDGQKWLFILFFAVLFIAVMSYREKLLKSPALSAAFGLVLGGGLGNIIDRLALVPKNCVTDYLDFHIKASEKLLSYPCFNLADMCIVSGCILIILLYKRTGGK